MKKLLLLFAVLLSMATANAQYGAPVRVVVRNMTAFKLYFAPRYHYAFYDGTTNGFTYQPEGLFEPVLQPGQSRVYSNASTSPGYAFQPNSSYASFNTTGVGMTDFATNPATFFKLMRLDWIRYAFSTSTLENAFYGGGIAHPVPSGFSQISGSPNPTVYVGNYNEMVIPYWSSTTTFTYNGVTVTGVWTATTYVPGQTQTVNILFY